MRLARGDGGVPAASQEVDEAGGIEEIAGLAEVSEPEDQEEVDADRAAARALRFLGGAAAEPPPPPGAAGGPSRVQRLASSPTAPAESPGAPVGEGAPATAAGRGASAAAEAPGAAGPAAAPFVERPAAAPGPAPVTGVAGAAPAAGEGGGLIADDDAATLTAGQMRKSDFLRQLRADACEAADRAMAESGRSTRGCPYVEQMLARYAGRPARQLERAVRLYAPEARGVSSASEYLPAVSARVARGAAEWARTGNLPSDVPAELREGALGGGMLGLVGAIMGAVSGVVSAVGRLFGKAEPGAEARTQVDQAALSDRLGPGRPLEPGARLRMEQAFGTSFGGVRVHTDAGAARAASDLDARAFTLGEHVAFGAGEWAPGTPAGDAILAHELAHVVQQRGAAPPAVSEPAAASGDHEHDADRAAAAAVVQLHAPQQALGRAASAARPALRSGPRLSRCHNQPAPPSPTELALTGRTAWTDELARDAMESYRNTEFERRDEWVQRYRNQIENMIRALPAFSVEHYGYLIPTYRDLLQRVQRLGALESAAASGLTSQDAMAQAQAEFMSRRARDALTARTPGGPAPTDAQVAAEHQRWVTSHSLAAQTTPLTDAEAARINAEVVRARTRFLQWLEAQHQQGRLQEVRISEYQIRPDAAAVHNRGQGVIAFDDDRGTIAVVGAEFVRMVNANPAYALPTIVHELWGHEMYGENNSDLLGQELYDQAAGRMPGYQRPAPGTRERIAEQDLYGYYETEIYSLLREVPYYTPNAPEHDTGPNAITSNYAPGPAVSTYIGRIIEAWEPRVAQALVRGLYQRFRIDRHLTPEAVEAFRQGVRDNFTPARGFPAGTIESILR